MRIRAVVTLVFTAATSASCSAGIDATVATSVATSAVTTAPSATTVAAGPSVTTAGDPAGGVGPIEGSFEVDGDRLWLECRGAGSPTVVFEAGLNTDSVGWEGILGDVAAKTRACRYDRAGLGMSRNVSTPGTMTVAGAAHRLRALLEAAGVGGPYLPVGWSYGGMIAREFASGNLGQIAGLVFVDSSHEDQFIDPFWLGFQADWRDGPYEVDLEESRAQLLAATDLGDVPTIVLTNGDATGLFERHWAPLQDALASMSSDSLHMVASGAGHAIPDDSPALVTAAVEAVIDAARSGRPIGDCDARFAEAECLPMGMVALLEQWDQMRAMVAPNGGGFPNGAYRQTLIGAEVEDATGNPQDWATLEVTWTMSDGRWSAEVVVDRGDPEMAADIYEVDGDQMAFRIPDDWKVPRTSGINTLRWSVDTLGTVTFEQIDSWPVEGWFLTPWIRVGDAAG